jgi:hypothetical protein
MPGRASYAKLLGVSTVAGIGFTVALFIAGLAFADDAGLLAQAKAGILAGSLAAGVLGAGVLLATPEVRTAGASAQTAARADAARADCSTIGGPATGPRHRRRQERAALDVHGEASPPRVRPRARPPPERRRSLHGPVRRSISLGRGA